MVIFYILILFIQIFNFLPPLSFIFIIYSLQELSKYAHLTLRKYLSNIIYNPLNYIKVFIFRPIISIYVNNTFIDFNLAY